uniref:BTB domain-containing protein n=1 Tax=Panagrolaimus davidi TaxID=227884 RepID=A0A914QPP9_9BILA
MLFVSETIYPSCVRESSSTLGDYLWERDDKDFIISVGKEGDESKTEIKVHKLILASRSPVFDKMIKSDMKEKSEGKVEIVDFDRDTVEAAVEYCYDQDIIYRYYNDLTIALLQFAEKYDMKDLKKDIETHLIKESLSPENVVEISNAAIISNSPILRRFCYDALLIFMRQGIHVEKRDVLDEEFAKELLDKALAGGCSFDENICEEVEEENFDVDLGCTTMAEKDKKIPTISDLFSKAFARKSIWYDKDE